MQQSWLGITQLVVSHLSQFWFHQKRSVFETAPTLPSLQAAIFEAATFRPCPLIVTNVEQSEWNTPHEFQPQAEPPTQLRHTTTLSVHCVLKEGGSTQPTLRTAVLEGLYEWINDPLEPIKPVDLPVATRQPDSNPCYDPTNTLFRPAIVLSTEIWKYKSPSLKVENRSRNLLQHSPMSSACYFSDHLGFMKMNCS